MMPAVCRASLLSPGDIIAELLGEGEHLLALVPGLSLHPDLAQSLDGLAVEIIMLKTGAIFLDLFSDYQTLGILLLTLNDISPNLKSSPVKMMMMGQISDLLLTHIADTSNNKISNYRHFNILIAALVYSP